MNKRLPFFLSLLGVVLFAVSLAYWIMQLYQPPQRPIAAAPQAAMPDPTIDAAATLFGGQVSVASATNYQLTGVVADGSSSVAIIVAEGSPPKALRVGKELAPGITLAEVHPRYVMLSDGGVMKRVDLATDTKPAAAMGGAPGGMPPSGAPPGGMPQQNFPQPQQITTAPAAQPVQAVPEPPMAPGAVQPQPSMTNPGDVGTHDNPPPANPNPINPTPNGQQMPPQNPAGQMNTQ
ncbi:type II secretion system protein N [Massilia sp. GER05]|jgi:general secretion pathway protein C|uniref:type II secretion system protein N n=1 Tax=unclassified Massilia TaxID=2609279 RepID=UPI0039A5D45F